MDTSAKGQMRDSIGPWSAAEVRDGIEMLTKPLQHVASLLAERPVSIEIIEADDHPEAFYRDGTLTLNRAHLTSGGFANAGELRKAVFDLIIRAFAYSEKNRGLAFGREPVEMAIASGVKVALLALERPDQVWECFRAVGKH